MEKWFGEKKTGKIATKSLWIEKRLASNAANVMYGLCFFILYSVWTVFNLELKEVEKHSGFHFSSLIILDERVSSDKIQFKEKKKMA